MSYVLLLPFKNDFGVMVEILCCGQRRAVHLRGSGQPYQLTQRGRFRLLCVLISQLTLGISSPADVAREKLLLLSDKWFLQCIVYLLCIASVRSAKARSKRRLLLSIYAERINSNELEIRT